VLGRLSQLKLVANDEEIAVGSRFFQVEGSVTYRRAHLRAQALLRRDGNRIETLWLREAG
jgi:hypothetical protein